MITARLRQFLKQRPRLLNVCRFLRNMWQCLSDAFRYGELAYSDNLAEQHKWDGSFNVPAFVSEMTRQRKYDFIFPVLSEGMRVLDIAAGTGELSVLLKKRFKSLSYVGIDYDPRRVEIARSLGRNVKELDCSDSEQLEDFIKASGPFDVAVCMYSFYFFPVPETFLANINGKVSRLVLGCFNGGHWTYRLRMLFGRGPRPSHHYYNFPQTNYAEMRRFWTLRDHRFVFRSLGWRHRMLAVKSDATGIHYPPQRFLFKSLFAKAFVFELEAASAVRPTG